MQTSRKGTHVSRVTPKGCDTGTKADADVTRIADTTAMSFISFTLCYSEHYMEEI